MGKQSKAAEAGAAHTPGDTAPDADAGSHPQRAPPLNNIPGQPAPQPLLIFIDLIRSINHFDSIADPSDTESVTLGGLTVRSYENSTLGRPLAGQRLSESLIYNPTIRGASGSDVVFTADFRFAIKIVRRSEMLTLRRHCRELAQHRSDNPGTLLVRYHGIYETDRDGAAVCFVLMSNVLGGYYERIYDLKGERVSRANRSGVLTEKDWRGWCRGHVSGPADGPISGPGDGRAILGQIRRDVGLLCRLNLMDYSIVIGAGPVRRSGSFRAIVDGRVDYIELGGAPREYSVGIVDILTKYDMWKRLETLWGLLCCRTNMSSVRPDTYKDRFLLMARRTLFDGHDEADDSGPE